MPYRQLFSCSEPESPVVTSAAEKTQCFHAFHGRRDFVTVNKTIAGI
jgi:hypothetical protein